LSATDALLVMIIIETSAVRRRLAISRNTDRVDEDDVRVVDFPQHLMNKCLSSARPAYQSRCVTQWHSLNLHGRENDNLYFTDVR